MGIKATNRYNLIMDKRYKVLKEYFGHSSFREFQLEAIDTILQGQDLLTILPTGGGKSLCYQLPTLLMDGLTVVITPLIALMQDQVAALKANGIAAQMVSSTQDSETIKKIYAQVYNRELKFLYVAPERLNQNFLQMLSQIELNFFVIDEAHCLSEWGHDFRSDYRKLGILKEHFKDIGVCAFTATATTKVQSDILQSLQLQNPHTIRAKAVRDNLEIHVRLRQDSAKSQIINFLQDFKDERGIIYTYTRKEAENLAEFLQQKGYNALAYHAGMPKQTRSSVHDAFIFDNVDIVVATIAFGMGIDKSNIRFVIHTSMPKTLEGYYQEIGRAGRDGAKSYALLLYKRGDEAIKKSLILSDSTNELQQTSLQKLRAMARFCSSDRCRHQYIAHYFDDTTSECEKVCDNCLRSENSTQDITVQAQKILSTIYRTGGRFGINYIINVLRGSKTKRIFEFGHDKLSVYGIEKQISKANCEAIVDRLIDLEYIDIDAHGSLKLLQKSAQVLKGEKEVFIYKDRLQKKTSYNIEQNSQEFEDLRAIRAAIAKKESIAAFMVFSDKTLLEMAKFLPGTKQMMLNITGVGAIKYERYGKEFLQKCQELKEKQCNP